MSFTEETDPLFESRKRDHIRIALDPRAQSSRAAGLDAIELIHEALPDLDFKDIDISTDFKGRSLSAPFFISSMTAGHEKGREINLALARLSERRGLLMGVGSQRRELENSEASREWKDVRKQAPRACLVGNIGIAQAIRVPTDRIRALVDGLEASALFIHLNPLQECLQPEGTPQFKGGLEAIARLVEELPVPIVVKETGCGISLATMKRLNSTGVFAVDVSGLGGTHWGRVEERRLAKSDFRADAAPAFQDWGIQTAQSLIEGSEAGFDFQLWASGGIRTGLDVAKCVAIGAKMVGLAHPWLEAAVRSDSDAALDKLADKLTFELKTSLFCTGARTPADLKTGRRWIWRN